MTAIKKEKENGEYEDKRLRVEDNWGDHMVVLFTKIINF